MPRFARLVVPGLPHHVTQRGNRRQPVFFSDADYRLYLRLLAASCERSGTAVWAWCLMPNHVHLILAPSHADGLRAALGEAHRRYTNHVNAREEWRGHLWQSRFASFPMDEDWTIACARYVELNPVRAGLVARPEDWPWSSARTHLGLARDGLTDAAALLAQIPDWRALLEGGLDETARDRIRAGERSGRPIGGAPFLQRLSQASGRSVETPVRGRPPRNQGH